MVEIGGKSKKELIHPSVNAFIHNFNIDRLMLVKYDGNESVELYNNTGYAFENERRSRIEGFFPQEQAWLRDI